MIKKIQGIIQIIYTKNLTEKYMILFNLELLFL